MLRLRPKPEERPDFEDVFFSSYRQLMEWALRLTGYDRENAEDLVHDLYLQFALSGSRLKNIEKEDAYLFSVMRNLHYARLRRAGRSPIDVLNIVDFDTVSRGLASVDRRQLLYVRSSLRAVCEYVCERKNTSKSASVLILRFIFGYFPSEVMQVVRTTRGAMDRLLQIARQEVRLHLERPHVLCSITPEARRTSFLTLSEDSHTLFQEMQQAIFRSCTGECLAAEELAQRYGGANEPGLTTAELAHLVSCRKCLDAANAILGLPLIADRSADDAIGRDGSQGPDGGSSSSTGGPSSVFKRSRKERRVEVQAKLDREVREVFEHRAMSLQIAVNGKVRASQKITSELSELDLKLGRTEKLDFIEIVSEQNIRIGYLHVFDPALQQGLEQSEHVSLSDGRTLDITLSFAGDVPNIHVVYRDQVITEEMEDDGVEDRINTSGLLERPPLEASQKHGPITRITDWLRSLGSRIIRSAPEMNPALATAMVFAVASLACFLVWLHQLPSITPNTLLVHAETWDRPHLSNPPGVIYQKVRIVTQRRTIEKALYRDAQGFRVPRRQPLGIEDSQLKDLLVRAGIDWDAPLSASSYKDWHDHGNVSRDSVTRVGSHLLRLTTTLQLGNVAQASLTVRDTDFHPVLRTVELRDAGTVEIAELNYDVMPWNAINGDWFEPIAALQTRGTSGVPASILPPIVVRLSDAELDEAELGARLALRSMEADTRERIELVRSPSVVLVRGIVATETLKHEIASRLNLVPHVATALYTFQEIENGRGADSEITSLKQISSVEGSSPLEDYLLRQGANHEIIGQLGHELFDASIAIHQEGRAIDDLLQRFAAGQSLTVNARASFNALLNDHRQKMLAALQTEEALLTKTKVSSEAGLATSTSSTLTDVAAANVTLCGELISDSNEHPRPAQEIVPELTRSISQLRAILDRLPHRSSVASSAIPAVLQNE